MPLKQCNHWASLLVYQQERHTCSGDYLHRKVIHSPRLCRYLNTLWVRLSKCERLDSLQWLSFERTISGSAGRANSAKTKASQTLILFLLLPYHTMTACESSRASRNTHITINKDMLWMSLDFNSPKYQKSAQEFHRVHSWSQLRFQGTDLHFVAGGFYEACPLFLLIISVKKGSSMSTVLFSTSWKIDKKNLKAVIFQ